MNTNIKNHYDIFDGPSKDRIFDACKYAYDKDRIRVKFGIALSYEMPINDPFKMFTTDFVIVSIEHEDGSGNKLNLSGYCVADLNGGCDIHDRTSYMDYDIRAFNHAHCSSEKVYDGKEYLEQYSFSAFYDTEKRKGHISFSK